MKDIVRNRIMNIITWMLMLSMGLMIANKAVFFHVHKLPNGEIVAHAHPFSKTDDTAPFKNHYHSKSEFHLFHHIDKLFVILFIAFVIILKIKRRISYHFSEHLSDLSPILVQKGRAPPAILS